MGSVSDIKHSPAEWIAHLLSSFIFVLRLDWLWRGPVGPRSACTWLFLGREVLRRVGMSAERDFYLGVTFKVYHIPRITVLARLLGSGEG